MARNSIGTTFGKTSRDAAVDISGGYHCDIAFWFVYFRPSWSAFFGLFSNNAQLAVNPFLAGNPNRFKADPSIRYQFAALCGLDAIEFLTPLLLFLLIMIIISFKKREISL
jgi:hypothetical protein